MCKMRDFTKKEEQVLLAVCNLGDDAYLMSIREEIRKYTGKYYAVGTIYAPLNRLHVYGYIKSRTVKPDSSISKKPISYFKLTKKGYEVLASIQRQNERMWKQVNLKSIIDKVRS